MPSYALSGASGAAISGALTFTSQSVAPFALSAPTMTVNGSINFQGWTGAASEATFKSLVTSGGTLLSVSCISTGGRFFALTEVQRAALKGQTAIRLKFDTQDAARSFRLHCDFVH